MQVKLSDFGGMNGIGRSMEKKNELLNKKPYEYNSIVCLLNLLITWKQYGKT